MIKRAGDFDVIVDHDRRDGALTGNALGTDHQLQHVDPGNIGGETGSR